MQFDFHSTRSILVERGGAANLAKIIQARGGKSNQGLGLSNDNITHERKDGFQSLPIHVAVEDNGPGIPDNIRPYLFDPFMTTKQGGRGLGLAIVSKIAASHGAALDVERTTKGHTRFKVMLPAMR